MSTIEPNELRVGDVVTMRDVFIITEVTDTHIWAGPVSYSKRSVVQTIGRSWHLFPVPASARPEPPTWPDVERRRQVHHSAVHGYGAGRPTKRRARSQPHHQSDERIRPTMTTMETTCALPFCELPSGHGWDSIGADGSAVRYHGRRTGEFVEVSQEETITPDRPTLYRAQFWAPGVYVEELLEPMTADQAVALASALLEAAEMVRDLTGPDTAAAFSAAC